MVRFRGVRRSERKRENESEGERQGRRFSGKEGWFCHLPSHLFSRWGYLLGYLGNLPCCMFRAMLDSLGIFDYCLIFSGVCGFGCRFHGAIGQMCCLIRREELASRVPTSAQLQDSCPLARSDQLRQWWSVRWLAACRSGFGQRNGGYRDRRYVPEHHRVPVWGKKAGWVISAFAVLAVDWIRRASTSVTNPALRWVTVSTGADKVLSEP